MQALEALYDACFVSGSPRPLPEMVLHLLEAVPLPPLDGAPLLFRVGPTQLQTCWQAADRGAGGITPLGGGGADGSGGSGGGAMPNLEGSRLEFGGSSTQQPQACHSIFRALVVI